MLVKISLNKWDITVKCYHIFNLIFFSCKLKHAPHLTSNTSSVLSSFALNTIPWAYPSTLSAWQPSPSNTTFLPCLLCRRWATPATRGWQRHKCWPKHMILFTTVVVDMNVKIIINLNKWIQPQMQKIMKKMIIPGECMGKLFSVMLLVHRLLSSGPDELVMDTCTHWP